MVVITNPPFSLFIDYTDSLFDHEKQFMILGSLPAITNINLWPHLASEDVWVGQHAPSKFAKPDGTFAASLTSWYIRLGEKPIPEPIKLGIEYPKYDGTDVIEVSKVEYIQPDYAGVMGVPISFLKNWNHDQFEIVGLANHGDSDWDLIRPYINGKKIFSRILIRNKHPQEG